MSDANMLSRSSARRSMNEILPGIFHWTAFHEGIGTDVSSYFVGGDDRTLIDPMEPDGGVDVVVELAPPEQIVLTNRHHYRHSGRFVDEFGCPVRCERSGLHEFEGGPQVEGFDFGEQLSPRITALEMGAICSEDTALHIEAGDGALAFADGLIRYRGSIGFVPDELMGEDAGAVKRGLHESLRRLLQREFDSLLFAHGEPLVGGGRAQLEAFVASEE
jgi:hypothetical protein